MLATCDSALSVEQQNALFEAHDQWAQDVTAPLIRRYDRCRRFLPGQLEAAVRLGLWHCAREFDPARGKSFKAFAYWRVFGALHDEMRQMSGVRDGRQMRPDGTRLAETSSEDVHTLCVQHVDESSRKGLDHVDRRDSVRALIKLASKPIGQRVLHLRYMQSMTFRQVGNVLGVSAVRVCQIEAEALEEIRRRGTAILDTR